MSGEGQEHLLQGDGGETSTQEQRVASVSNTTSSALPDNSSSSILMEANNNNNTTPIRTSRGPRSPFSRKRLQVLKTPPPPDSSLNWTTTSSVSSSTKENQHDTLSLVPCRKVSIVVCVNHTDDKSDDDKLCVFPPPSLDADIAADHSTNATTPTTRSLLPDDRSTTTRELILVNPSAFGQHIPAQVTYETAKLVAQVAHVESEDWARIYNKFHEVIWPNNNTCFTQLTQAMANDVLYRETPSVCFGLGSQESGRTGVMFGSIANGNHRTSNNNVFTKFGMLGSTLEQLYNCSTRPIVCTLSLLEIVEEDVLRDLLATNPHHLTKAQTPLRLRHYDHKGAVVLNLSEHPVDSMEGLEQLLRKAFRSSKKRSSLSRGHVVATLKVFANNTKRTTLGDTKNNNCTVLGFVDLASGQQQDVGPPQQELHSEKTRRSRRTVSVRKSLSGLRGVLRGLLLEQASQNDKNKKPIPFRECTLTKVLQRVLEQPDSRAIVLSSVSPSSHAYDRTLQTLNYTHRLLMRIGETAKSPFDATVTPSKTTTTAATTPLDHFSDDALLKSVLSDPRQRLAKLMSQSPPKQRQPSQSLPDDIEADERELYDYMDSFDSRIMTKILAGPNDQDGDPDIQRVLWSGQDDEQEGESEDVPLHEDCILAEDVDRDNQLVHQWEEPPVPQQRLLQTPPPDALRGGKDDPPPAVPVEVHLTPPPTEPYPETQQSRTRFQSPSSSHDSWSEGTPTCPVEEQHVHESAVKDVPQSTALTNLEDARSPTMEDDTDRMEAVFGSNLSQAESIASQSKGSDGPHDKSTRSSSSALEEMFGEQQALPRKLSDPPASPTGYSIDPPTHSTGTRCDHGRPPLHEVGVAHDFVTDETYAEADPRAIGDSTEQELESVRRDGIETEREREYMEQPTETTRDTPPPAEVEIGRVVQNLELFSPQQHGSHEAGRGDPRGGNMGDNDLLPELCVDASSSSDESVKEHDAVEEFDADDMEVRKDDIQVQSGNIYDLPPELEKPEASVTFETEKTKVPPDVGGEVQSFGDESEPKRASLKRTENLGEIDEGLADLHLDDGADYDAPTELQSEMKRFSHEYEFDLRDELGEAHKANAIRRESGVIEEISVLETVVDEVKRMHHGLYESSTHSLERLRESYLSQQEQLREATSAKAAAEHEKQLSKEELDRQAQQHLDEAARYQEEIAAAEQRLLQIAEDKVAIEKIAEDAITAQDKLEREIVALTDEIDASRKETADLAAKYGDAITSRDELSHELQAFKDLIDLVRAEKEQHEVVISELEETIRHLQNEQRTNDQRPTIALAEDARMHEDTRLELSVLEDEVERLKMDNHELGAELARTMQEKSDMEDMSREASRLRSELHLSRQYFEEETSSLKHSIQSLDDERSQLQRELSDTQHLLLAAQAQQQEVRATVDQEEAASSRQVDEEQNRLVEEIARLDCEMRKDKEYIERLEELRENLRQKQQEGSQEQDSASWLQEALEENAAQRNENDRLRETVDRLMEERDSVQHDVPRPARPGEADGTFLHSRRGDAPGTADFVRTRRQQSSVSFETPLPLRHETDPYLSSARSSVHIGGAGISTPASTRRRLSLDSFTDLERENAYLRSLVVTSSPRVLYDRTDVVSLERFRIEQARRREAEQLTAVMAKRAKDGMESRDGEIIRLSSVMEEKEAENLQLRQRLHQLHKPNKQRYNTG